MAEFKNILKETLLNEGGFTNDPLDSGGMTLFGIARNKNPQWVGWKYFDSIVTSNSLNINDKNDWGNIAKVCKNIDSVENFYRVNFWNQMKGELILSNVIAHSMFDYGVNVGMVISIKNAQRVLGITDDGIFGNISLSALNSYILTKSTYKFHEEFTFRKILRYYKIVTSSPNNKNLKYIFGWTSRSFENMEAMYDLDIITEPTFANLYKFIEDGRASLKVRQDIDKCLSLIKACLDTYKIT